MAKDSLGSIITIGAVGVGAYWLYNTFFSAPAVVPVASAPASTSSSGTVATGTPAAATTPAWMASLAALGSQLQTMAGASQQNIDQWSTYYNNLRQQRNMPELTGAQVSAILAVNPATVASRAATIGAPEYVNDIFNLGYGLAGVRRGMGAVRTFNPIMRLPFRTPQLGYRRAAR